MPQATETLTIGCTEGWSTTQHWTGVRLVDLARVVGAPPGAILRTLSLESVGPGANVALAHDLWSDRRALLALRVNGADLSLDHGYPARVILVGGTRRAQHQVGARAQVRGGMSGRSLLAHFRRRYGASPLHLAGHLVVFAIAAFAHRPDRQRSAGIAAVIALYVGFVIAHDLIFLPLYSRP